MLERRKQVMTVEEMAKSRLKEILKGLGIALIIIIVYSIGYLYAKSS